MNKLTDEYIEKLEEEVLVTPEDWREYMEWVNDPKFTEKLN